MLSIKEVKSQKLEACLQFAPVKNFPKYRRVEFLKEAVAIVDYLAKFGEISLGEYHHYQDRIADIRQTI